MVLLGNSLVPSASVRCGGLYVSLLTDCGYSTGVLRIAFTPVEIISDWIMGIVRLVHSLRSREDTLSRYLHVTLGPRVEIVSWREVISRRFAVKATLVGGVVYYSVRQGLWSRSEDSVQLYGRLYNNIAPYVKDNIPKEVVNEVGCPFKLANDISASLEPNHLIFNKWHSIR